MIGEDLAILGASRLVERQPLTLYVACQVKWLVVIDDLSEFAFIRRLILPAHLRAFPSCVNRTPAVEPNQAVPNHGPILFLNSRVYHGSTDFLDLSRIRAALAV